MTEQINVDGKKKWTPCSPGDSGAVEKDWMSIAGDALTEPPLTLEDFLKALENTRPTVNAADLEKQEQFTAEFGSVHISFYLHKRVAC